MVINYSIDAPCAAWCRPDYLCPRPNVDYIAYASIDKSSEHRKRIKYLSASIFHCRAMDCDPDAVPGHLECGLSGIIIGDTGYTKTFLKVGSAGSILGAWRDARMLSEQRPNVSNAIV